MNGQAFPVRRDTEFTAIFCRLFDFELIPDSYKEGIRIDFVIETENAVKQQQAEQHKDEDKPKVCLL
ncbi:MAG: hypothetical protein ACQEXQ_12585 [Bacillota bacterium]